MTTADFYFPTEPRPLLAFVDGPVHLGKAQVIKDEETRSLLRKRGYKVLELYYDYYTDKKKNNYTNKYVRPWGRKKLETVLT